MFWMEILYINPSTHRPTSEPQTILFKIQWRKKLISPKFTPLLNFFCLFLSIFYLEDNHNALMFLKLSETHFSFKSRSDRTRHQLMEVFLQDLQVLWYIYYIWINKQKRTQVGLLRLFVRDNLLARFYIADININLLFVQKHESSKYRSY